MGDEGERGHDVLPGDRLQLVPGRGGTCLEGPLREGRVVLGQVSLVEPAGLHVALEGLRSQSLRSTLARLRPMALQLEGRDDLVHVALVGAGEHVVGRAGREQPLADRVGRGPRRPVQQVLPVDEQVVGMIGEDPQPRLLGRLGALELPSEPDVAPPRDLHPAPPERGGERALRDQAQGSGAARVSGYDQGRGVVERGPPQPVLQGSTRGGDPGTPLRVAAEGEERPAHVPDLAHHAGSGPRRAALDMQGEPVGPRSQVRGQVHVLGYPLHATLAPLVLPGVVERDRRRALTKTQAELP